MKSILKYTARVGVLKRLLYIFSSTELSAWSLPTPLSVLGGAGLVAWALWRWWSSPCWTWDSWRPLLTRKTPTAPLMTERDRARPASRSPWYAWIYVLEGERGSLSVWIVCVELQCNVSYHFLQLDDRAKRHRPWPHADWLSSHPSKGIRGADGAVLYPGENKDNTSLQGR